MGGIDWLEASKILLTGLASAVFTGILAFSVQSLIKRWLSRSLEEFKLDLQLKAFEHQSWWEKKSEAYSQIIARLVDLQYCLGRWFDMFVLDKELDSEARQKLVEESRQAREYLTKAAAAGAYIVSGETVAALEELLRELDKRHPYDVVEEIDMHYASVKKCIAEIREYAEKDMHKR